MLGKIAEPYGVRGWVKIYPHADDPLDWVKVPVWWIGRDGLENWRTYKVIQCKQHGSALVAQLEGVADRTAAEALKGLLVGAPKENLPALAPDEYYWADLIDLQVVNLEGNALGKVAGLIETGANDVLRVVDPVGVERLIPYVDAVVKAVDIGAGQLLVEWGLDW